MTKAKTTSKNIKSQWKGVKDCKNSLHQTLVTRMQFNASTTTATENPKALRTLERKSREIEPLKRSKRISFNEQMKLGKLPLSVSLEAAHLTTQGWPSRKTTSKTPRITISDTPKPPKRSKRMFLSKQSNLKVSKLSGSLEVSSTNSKTRGRPSRKITSKNPRTTDSQFKRPKKTYSNEQSNLKDLPVSVRIGVSSAHRKMRGRPSGKTTPKTRITTCDTSMVASESSKRSRTCLLLENSSTNVGRQFRKRTVQTASNVKELCTITPTPKTRSKRTTSRSQSNFKEPPVSISSKALSLKTGSIVTRDTSSLMHPKMKASKKETLSNVSLERHKKTRLGKEKNQKKPSFNVSVGGSSATFRVRGKQSRKTTTITTNKREGQTEITSVPVTLKRSKRIALINENKRVVSLAASAALLKTRRNQSSICTRSKTTNGIASNRSQLIQKSTKTTKSSAFPSRSPIHVDFQNCDEISLSQNGILENQMKNSFTSTPKKRENTTETSETLSTPSTLTSPFSSRSSRTPSKPSNAMSKRRSSIRVSSLEPLISKRNTPTCKDRSDFQLAKESLHVSAVPETLICRETEYKEIYKLIECTIIEKSGGCMYVSGVPGSGKTATITTVIKSLQLQTAAKTLPEFKLIEINGMRLTVPEQAYVHIYQQITGEKVSWEQACSLLAVLFQTSSLNRKTTVLVVDEFDKMKSQRDRVIFNLLDWTTKKTAQLFMIAIGNIINPSQLITSAINSRLGSTRFTFQPYTHNELQKIVQARLTGINIFDNEAIQLVAKKVASISGDCRRALDICRRAVEIAEKDCVGKEISISTSHVCKAFDEMITNLKVIAIKGCSKYEKLFLQAVASEVARTGVDETVLFQVYRQLESICALNGVAVPDPGIALRISSRLGSSRLLICEHSSASIHQKIMLNVTEDELRYDLDM